MRFTTRGLTLMFTRNADLQGGKAMSLNAFMKVAEDSINKSVWRTSNIPPKRLSIPVAIKHTAEYCGLDLPKFLKCRERFYVEPRIFISIYLRKERYPLTAIGYAFKLHHASIVHYEKVAKDLFQTDKEFHKRYIDLEFHLNSLKNN